ILRADSFFGCRSKTPHEILAASRSCPSAADGCSCSAASRYFVAESSGSSTCTPVVRRAGIVFTVASLEAHPHHWNRRRAKEHLTKTCHLVWRSDGMSSLYLSPAQSVKLLTGSFAEGLQHIYRATVHHVFQFRESLIRCAIGVNNDSS